MFGGTTDDSAVAACLLDLYGWSPGSLVAYMSLVE